MRRFAICLAVLCTGCPALMSAALEGSEVDDHEPRAASTAKTSTATPTTTTTTTTAAAAGPTDATYTITIGEAVSATNPKLARPTTSLSKGSYVTMKFETSAEGFGMDGVDVTLYALEHGTRTVATHRRSTFKPTDDVLYKSWQIKQRGSYVIEVKSPAGKLLATGTFQVV